MIKGYFDSMEGGSLLYVTALPNLMVTDIVVVAMFLIYHLVSGDHVFKGLCNFVGRSYL